MTVLTKEMLDRAYQLFVDNSRKNREPTILLSPTQYKDFIELSLWYEWIRSLPPRRQMSERLKERIKYRLRRFKGVKTYKKIRLDGF